MRSLLSTRVQLGLLAGLFACTLLALPVSAAEQTGPSTESILLSPASKRYELQAGQARSDTLRVVNDGQVAFDFAVYARPYYVSTESYDPNFTTAAQNADVYKWVTFDKASFRLEPGQAIEVPYTVRVPQGTTPGGHYGVLFAETQPSGDAAAGSVVRKKRVGSIVYATVQGDVRQSGKSLGLDVPFFQFRAPLSVSERVQNNGNTHFVVTTNVEVTDLFGGVKYRHAQESTVLPSVPRRITSNWENPSWIGLYKVTQSSSFLDTKRSSTHYVLLVPIWVYVSLVLLIGARIAYAVVQRKKK